MSSYLHVKYSQTYFSSVLCLLLFYQYPLLHYTNFNFERSDERIIFLYLNLEFIFDFFFFFFFFNTFIIIIIIIIYIYFFFSFSFFFFFFLFTYLLYHCTTLSPTML